MTNLLGVCEVCGESLQIGAHIGCIKRDTLVDAVRPDSTRAFARDWEYRLIGEAATTCDVMWRAVAYSREALTAVNSGNESEAVRLMGLAALALAAACDHYDTDLEQATRRATA